MTTKLDNRYFNWLKKKVDLEDGGGYDGLLRHLHSREFVWLIPNDDNRVEDGIEVRKQFYGARHLEYQMPNNGVSVLEAIVALSRRLEFNADGDAPAWAWTLIKNLGLADLKDPLTPRQEKFIDEVLDALIWRTYEHNGSGGFFPLSHPEEDQTQVEIWYQMSAYIREHHLV